MLDLIRQLERLAATARRMLVARRACQFLTAALATLAAAGAVDFVLRLPGGLRLMIGLGTLGFAGWWLVTRLTRALALRPDATTLALRIERLYPHLRDHLASAVEFASRPDAYAQTPLSAALSGASMQQAQRQARDLVPRRLLDPAGLLRWVAVLAGAVLAAAALVAVNPPQAALALQRWFLPLGEAQWPRRTQIQSLVAARVWPTDTPLRFEAMITQGYRPGMRAWVHTRLVRDGQAGPWQAILLNDQGQRNGPGRDGRFERIVELHELLGDSPAAPGHADSPLVLELSMSAGDDRTPTQRLALWARPALRQAIATVEPPAYAQGLVPAQEVALDEQTGSVATVSALRGSSVSLALTFNRTLPIPDLGAVLPGLPRDEPAAVASPAATLHHRFTLDQTVQTPILLADEHGLRSVSERVYRFEAVQDKPPSVALVEPVADEAVLPTAVIDLEAAAQDDVGVQRLDLEMLAPLRDAQTSSDTLAATPLHTAEGRSPRLRLRHTLQLTPLALRPGDQITLTALAQDGFALGAERHDPVRSLPRTLRIIDEATLIGQVRSELANVRQQAIRLETAQRQAMSSASPEEPAAAPDPATQQAAQQQQLGRRLDAPRQTVASLAQRLERNRLDEPVLSQTLDRAADLIDQARRASDEATRLLRQRQQQEGQLQQVRARDALGELIALLDQGRDALTLQLQLRQMLTQQEQLADDTRRLLPQTAGRSPQDLSPELARALEDAAQRQVGLAQQAQELARQMQTTADALQRQSEGDQDQAAAQALREAAQIAQRQGLSPRMSQAADAARQNRLSEAGQEQLGAIDTLQQMMGALGSQPQKRMEMLRRRLAQLAELIRKLVEQQQAQLARLEAVADPTALALLDEGVLALRRNTMSVEAEARKSPQTSEVATSLEQASTAQGAAVTALRAQRRDDADNAQRQSLALLEQALRQIEQARQQAQQDMTQAQRQELEEAYRQLARQQDQLRQRTAALTPQPRLDRRQRAELVQLGHEQADLQIAAAELRDKVEQTLVFLQAHRRIDESAARVARQLRAGQSDPAVVFEQEMIRDRLTAMAEALQTARQDEQTFRENSGGGSGGGGAGQPPPLIPPVAELKLIRGTQDALYRQTRALDAQRQAADQAADLEPRLRDLSAQQRELSELGQRLIEQVKHDR